MANRRSRNARELPTRVQYAHAGLRIDRAINWCNANHVPATPDNVRRALRHDAETVAQSRGVAL